jgi:hypothetical protein
VCASLRVPRSRDQVASSALRVGARQLESEEVPPRAPTLRSLAWCVDVGVVAELVRSEAAIGGDPQGGSPPLARPSRPSLPPPPPPKFEKTAVVAATRARFVVAARCRREEPRGDCTRIPS